MAMNELSWLKLTLGYNFQSFLSHFGFLEWKKGPKLADICPKLLEILKHLHLYNHVTSKTSQITMNELSCQKIILHYNF